MTATSGSFATALIASASILTSCGSQGEVLMGQSGSEAVESGGPGAIGSGGSSVACPCAPFLPVLRVTVLDQDELSLSLRVEEVLYGDVPLEQGQEIEATWDGVLPCYLGNATVAVGEQAFASYDARKPCLAGCVLTPNGGGCQLCPPALPEDWTQGRARLTQWTTELLFAQTDEAELTVLASEVQLLWESSLTSCVGRFGDWSGLPGAFEGAIP